MDKDWAWAEPYWHKHFDAIGGDRATVRRVDIVEFGTLFKAHMLEHFPDEAFFRLDQLIPEPERARRKQSSELLGRAGPSFFALLEIEGELAAMFSGCAFSDHAWRMWTTVVATKFRRQGLYSEIIDGHLGYSRDLGFDLVRSEHAPCNNAILIAKLRAGFHLTAMEIDAEHGISAILTYFHRPEHRNAYLYRCGMAVMTPPMLASGNAAMQELAAKFSAKPKD